MHPPPPSSTAPPPPVTHAWSSPPPPPPPALSGSTSSPRDPCLTGPVLVVSLDPGSSISFVCVRICTSTQHSSAEVVAFGRISIPSFADILPHQAADAALTSSWSSESSWLSHSLLEGMCSDLLMLVSVCQARGDRVIFVLERQRGYLREHLHDPLAALISDIGWRLVSMPPSEKFHRLGVTADKTECVTCAARHFQGTPLQQFLTRGPVSRCCSLCSHGNGV
mmetsp:Transcript_59955/g.147393  ORF Transcript_59955/g.147393 Transcript_59955/m.147393 type:complete len:223 (+) Transcript_59955:73-741(+)